MFFLSVIEYLSAILISFYLVGALIAWVYEIRKNKLYQQMQNSLRILQERRLSAALNYAKAYKIRHDYLREIEPLERVQKIILTQVLFLAKDTNKTGKGWL